MNVANVIKVKNSYESSDLNGAFYLQFHAANRNNVEFFISQNNKSVNLYYAK